MADRTVVKRVKEQRDARLAEGWEEVRVWVPSREAATEVRNLAAELRAKAEALDGLTREVPIVTPETAARVATAIAEHGSKAYNTPSGAVLDLLSAMAREDNLTGFSQTVVIVARAKPANAKFIIAKVPAKIADFLVRHRGISAEAHFAWSQANPQWAEELKDAVRDPARFELAVEQMAESIKAFRKPN